MNYYYQCIAMYCYFIILSHRLFYIHCDTWRLSCYTLRQTLYAHSAQSRKENKYAGEQETHGPWSDERKPIFLSRFETAEKQGVLSPRSRAECHGKPRQ